MFFKDSDSIKTVAAAGAGIASSSWESIKGFFAEATIQPPPTFDLVVARMIALASLAYILLKIWKLWKSKETPKD